MVVDQWSLLTAAPQQGHGAGPKPSVSCHVASVSKCLKSVGELGEEPTFCTYVASGLKSNMY